MTLSTHILRCANGSYHAGQTDDLDQHTAGHHSGQIAGYTASSLRVALGGHENFQTRRGGAGIKPWSRAKKEALIRSDGRG
ncbi:GIY-YIG nuclease family protein [Sphingomonas sp.]|uniref:GIY-YIG nuclease family protein n=1 Tax=Sphingomonas sp. TaxID=28214 RepID=UPI000DB7CD08|nr:GIY-YIG nuclease family protein [Sphingomonas sp.]PZU08718.1 MAG: GIY-YIG nuclease family protein [Sphingomonas sp.]